jgi:hypothetical protein
MTSSRLLILAAATATLVVAGCNRDRDPAPAAAEAPTAAATASAASPMSYESKTAYAEVELSLPSAIKTQPDLHAALYADEVRGLRQFAEGAQGERTEAGSPTDMPPYSKAIAVTVAADTPRLLSLKREDFDYSGGAHPNTLQSGILWDKALKRRLTSADLFAKGADLSVLDQALCSAINAAKRERSPDAVNLTLGGGDDWNCPRAGSTPFVLARGSEPGKAGGLTFLIDPYQVGPYVEGAYEIDLPLSVLRPLLAREYAGEFGGALVKADAGPA